MTAAEIRAMQPGREMDMLIARHVFGIDTEMDRHGRPWAVYRNDPSYPHPGPMQMYIIADYSTDVAVAWQVFERLGVGWAIGRIEGDKPWWCWKGVEGGVAGTQAPEAIGKAALIDRLTKEEATP